MKKMLEINKIKKRWREMIKSYLFTFFLISTLFLYCSTDSHSEKRQRMVDFDIKARGIKDPAVISAMSKVPRHLFVNGKFRKFAYGDHPLPIGQNQTISQPYIVALMTELLELKSSDRVLEIGTGSGYQAAVLGEIVREVFSIEIIQPLAKKSRDLLKKLGYKHIRVKYGDGYFGWKEHAPFDAIIITAAPQRLPPLILQQLKEGGRLILPLGKSQTYQELILLKKVQGKIQTERIIPVRFVPMTGEIKK
jgi:protein-L-isoaspartate(D-aspartate) O-methyltransferase